MNGLLLTLPVALPFTAGLLSYFIRFPSKHAQNLWYGGIICLTTALAWLAILLVGEERVTLLHFTDTLTIALRCDGAARLFAALSATLWPFTALYACDYMRHEKHLAMFWSFFTASFGVTLGIASGLLFREEATTGGSELGAWILRSRIEGFSIGNICLGIDLTIIMIYASVFKSLNNALYGALALYITTKVLDLVVYGQNTAKLAYIISNKYEEIMREMIKLDKGVTLLHGKGGYTGEDRPLLLCAVHNKEAVMIKRFIKELDPDAFFIVCDASEVLGEGFGQYNPKGL